MPNSFVIKLTSPSTRADLPYSLEAKKVKIVSLRYVTASSNNEFMLVNLTDFNHNNTYFDGSLTKSYTKMIMLNPTINTFTYYENLSNTYFDHIRDVPTDKIRQLNIEVLIDGSFSSDINGSNPVYIELYFE